MAATTRADIEVVAAARAGDLRAWLEVTRRHQEAVFRSAFIAARDADVAEEVTRRTFSRAYRSLASLEEGSAILPWLMGISSTVARAYLREMSQRRDAKSVETIAFPRRPATPIQLDPRLPIPTTVERDALSSAFARCSDHDRLVLAARYAFALDRSSAARRLGVSPDQVEQELRDSVRRLRVNFDETLSEPPVARPGTALAATPVAQAGDRIGSLPDDALGTLTTAVALSEVPWTPDVSAIVCDSLAREAVSYPDAQVTRSSETGSRADTTARGSNATPRRRGWSSPRTIALFVGVAFVGFSIAAVASGPTTTDEVGTRIAGLLAGSDTRFPPVEAPPPDAPSIQAASSSDPELQQTKRDALGVAIVGAARRGNGDVRAQVRLDWSRPSDMGTVVRSRLERRTEGGPWTTIARTDDADPMRTAIKPGARYTFRLRSFGADGRPRLSPETNVELVMRGPRSSRLTRHGHGWVVRDGPFGNRLVGIGSDLSLATTFTGSHVAILGPAGSDRGAVEVRVDAGPWVAGGSDRLRPPAGAVRFSDSLDDGRHDLDIRGGPGGLALDGILFLRRG